MYAQRKPIDNTHIVRERDRERFRELLAVLSLGVPVGLFLLLFTWQNLEVIRLGREATRLQRLQEHLEDTNKKQRLDIERLKALDQVERNAIRLGFEPTPAGSVVVVEDPAPPPPLRERGR